MAALPAGALLEADEDRTGDRRSKQGGTAYDHTPLTAEVGGDFVVSENHRLCRWFQKALAMHKKSILLW